MIVMPGYKRRAMHDSYEGVSALERLVAIIRQGGTCTSASLARQIGVSPRLVEMMLVDLEAKGYVARAQPCRDTCSNCEAAGARGAPGSAPLLWTARPRAR
jgi:hypothetical protein